MDELIKDIPKSPDTPVTDTFLPQEAEQAQEIREAQQPLTTTFSESFAPAASAVKRRVTDEAEGVRDSLFTRGDDGPVQETLESITAGALSLFYTPSDPTYNKEEHRERLLKDIPLSLQDNILEEGNLAAAERTRARIKADLERGKRLMQQEGLSPSLAILAGGVVDVDLPLTFFTGGGYKAANVSYKALKLGKAAGLSPKAALRLSSTAVGVNAGLQAGLTTGLVEAAVRDTAEWTLVGEAALTSALVGGALNNVIKGDTQLAVQNAQKELHRQIRENAPELKTDANVDDTVATPVREPRAFEVPEVNSTAGASAVTPLKGVQRTIINDPAGHVPDNIVDRIDAFTEWRHDSGWLDNKHDVQDDFWTKVALSKGFNLSTSNFTSLYKSEAAGANFLAGNVFESPNGLGRGKFTAAAGMEAYQRRMFSPIARDVQRAGMDWAKANNVTWQGSGYGMSTQGSRMFNREVLLEMNNRAMGRQGTRDANISKAADAYDKAGREVLGIAKGKDGQRSVDGFENIPEKSGYSPYVWKGRQLLDLEKSGVVKRTDVIAAMSTAYRNAGMAQGKDADLVAKAVITRAIAKDVQDIDTNLIGMLSGDGRQFLADALKRDGVSDVEVKNIMERLTGNLMERGKDSSAKSRNNIDLNQSIPTSDGSDVKIVDLMDNDMHGTWQRYTRRMAGSSALARVGITNKAQREEVITAIQTEQRSLGEEPMDGDMLRAMFSNFNGGPVHGYFRGNLNEGVGAEIAIAKRATNLALLGKLGFAQLAETGTQIAQSGLDNWWRRGPAAAFNKELRAGNKELLDDMSYMLGDLGYDHKHFAEWLDLDDVSRGDRNDWIAAASKYTSYGQFAQGYTSLFNQVRGHQQRIAAMGMVDKVVRTVKQNMDGGTEISQGVMNRFQSDLGLDAEDIRAIENLLVDGTIEMGTRGSQEFVNKLNFEKWDNEFAEIFASSITRNINQTVQKSMAGEQDAWMHTHWGSIMSHLKTFPLQAMQKQFVRNARHSDMQTLSTVLMGLGTAMAAISIRDVIDGKDRDVGDMAKTAFSYSNMTGWVPMFVDPTMTLLGLEDYRWNSYGPHNDYTPPVVTQLNRMARLPGAVIDTVTGNDDWYDRQSLKALPYANTLGLTRLFD